MMEMRLALRPPRPQVAPKHRWTVRMLSNWWEELVAVVPPEWLPVDAPKENRRRVRRIREYGCGRYGCVYPTGQPGLVFKLTTDRSEAAFVVAAMQLSEWPEGMVRYHRIYQLEGESHYRRPVYALWRQEGHNVGDLGGGISERYQRRFGVSDCRSFVEDLRAFQKTAARVRSIVRNARRKPELLARVAELSSWARTYYRHSGPKWLRGAEHVAVARLECESLAAFMSGNSAGYLVGQALDYYLDHGLLLADLHLGNIGELFPPDFTTWELGITDPGHMVPLDAKWLDLEVPLLERKY